MLDDHRRRRRPVVRRGRHDRCGAGVLRKAGERGGDAGAGVTDMGDDGGARAGVLDRKADQRALFHVGQAHRFAGVHRHREGLGAMAQMKVEHRAVAIEIDAAVVRKRRQRRVHQAGFEEHCLTRSFEGCRDAHQPCGSVCRIPSSSSWARI